MRLWSIHPKYLDPQGLVALWREGLLAQKVLAGKTKGYQNHPQLERFRRLKDPELGIGTYLSAVWEEASQRGYEFDQSKINQRKANARKMSVTRGQLQYEFAHLSKKLQHRNLDYFSKIEKLKRAKPHSLFRVVPGKIASWERPATNPRKQK